ncbi:hypothetical protein CONPUDRAFT_43093, partial [Coniophora puteana RWD-64-598 SS2]
DRLKQIADSTLRAIEAGHITIGDVSHDLSAKIRFSTLHTLYYPPDSDLSSWSRSSPISRPHQSLASHPQTEYSVLEISTLDGVRLLNQHTRSSSPGSFGRVALLNFASATKPGGGFLSGAQAQEESIARSSTLYPSLIAKPASQFYALHGRDRAGGFYYDAMIYTPGVVVVRDDAGGWVEPEEADVLTSAAVNAGDVRNKNKVQRGEREIEERIVAAMRERMGRILYLFELQGARNLVLGSFGTGVFRNDVDVVAALWAELLSTRFKDSFERVLFAVLGAETFKTFKETF